MKFIHFICSHCGLAFKVVDNFVELDYPENRACPRCGLVQKKEDGFTK